MDVALPLTKSDPGSESENSDSLPRENRSVTTELGMALQLIEANQATVGVVLTLPFGQKVTP
jgi:hypothetical protein